MDCRPTTPRPGFLLSRSALLGLDAALPSCAREVATDHADTEMGRCVHRHLKLGCCQGTLIQPVDSKDFFVQRHKDPERDGGYLPWPANHLEGVTLHPLKTAEGMAELHEAVQRLERI